jgi:hypothetical protein
MDHKVVVENLTADLYGFVLRTPDGCFPGRLSLAWLVSVIARNCSY